jgi:hypothetical protein
VRVPIYVFAGMPFMITPIFSFLFFSLMLFCQDHVFLSINPPNRLELSNLAHKSTVEELREQIFPMWPTGVAHQERYGYDWRVKFTGSPWHSKGQESIM